MSGQLLGCRIRVVGEGLLDSILDPGFAGGRSLEHHDRRSALTQITLAFVSGRGIGRLCAFFVVIQLGPTCGLRHYEKFRAPRVATLGNCSSIRWLHEKNHDEPVEGVRIKDVRVMAQLNAGWCPLQPMLPTNMPGALRNVLYSPIRRIAEVQVVR